LAAADMSHPIAGFFACCVLTVTPESPRTPSR
jgi:hypothetical protein